MRYYRTTTLTRRKRPYTNPHIPDPEPPPVDPPDPEILRDVIWRGDYETGNFRQWHQYDNCDQTKPYYWQIPAYARPVKITGDGWSDSYFGDGSCLSLATTPVRSGTYSAKFTVKNSVNGSEVDNRDCTGTNCAARRTELNMLMALSACYNALPYQQTRWISFSIFLPEDWNTADGKWWGPMVLQCKPRKQTGGSIAPCFTINASAGGSSPSPGNLRNDSWEITHNWTNVENPDNQQSSENGRDRYSKYTTLAGLLPDFPDETASKAALGDLNIGGWTDWIIQVRPDARGVALGGEGFLRMWKRAGSGDWVEVLHMIPRVYTNHVGTFDRGIWFNAPASGSFNGGFGLSAGLYMHKDQVWNLSANRVIYNDNIRVFSENTNFAGVASLMTDPA